MKKPPLIRPDLPGGHDTPPAGALIDDVYAELRGIAARLMLAERAGHVLQPTALVNEAYLRLPEATRRACGDRTQLIATVVAQMKWTLLDYARRAGADKRPDRRWRVTLDQQLPAVEENLVDLLDLCRVLAELERLNERHCRVFELRFFGGFSVAECAQLLAVSARTIKSDWHFAAAWVTGRLAAEPSP